MATSTLLGKTVDIKESGDWGVVKAFDGDYYHVAIFGDDKALLIFTRSEFTIRKVA